MTKKKRILIIMLAAVFVAVASFSLFFTAYEYRHECVSENCSICAVLSGCSELIRKLGTGCSATGVPHAPAVFTLAVLCFAAYIIIFATPVRLKVKISA